MLKTYKYRLRPNTSQLENIRKNTDACRFVYNWALETKKAAYETNGTTLSWYDLNNRLKKLKQEQPWIRTAYSQSLQQSIKRLDLAFKAFYRRVKKGEAESGYPKYRSRRHHRQSFDVPQHFKIDFKERRAYLPKIGWVRTVFHRTFTGTAKTCTIVSTNTGKHFISIVIDDGKVHPKKKRVTERNSVGIDVGLKTYATLSTGLKFKNPRYLQSSLRRLQCLHRRLSRKKKGSKNQEKARLNLAKYYEKISDQRRDFQQKLSTQQIRENQAIMVESLNVSGMRKNRRLSKAISDAAWSSFLGMLKYKAELYGVTLVEVGMFEPTSKLCNKCGFKNDELTLKDREWTCSECKTHHDRDINAALNIKMIGFKIHHASGEPGEEPVELPTVVGVTKQETQSFKMG